MGASSSSDRAAPTLALLLALLALSALVYLPGLSGTFVFDDFPNLVQNPALRLDTLSAGGLWRAAFSMQAGPTGRPLSMLSFALQTYWLGLDPWGMKLVNLLIHLANGVLLFVLLRRVLRQVTPASGLLGGTQALGLTVTAAWLLAPINLTSVLFVVQRMESLAVLFTLGGLLAYVAGRQRMLSGDRRGLAWCWAGLTMGMGLGVLAKESAALTPIYALVLELLVFKGRSVKGGGDRALVPLYLALLILPGLLGAIWLGPGILSGTAYSTREFTLAERLWTEGRVLWSYLYWIVLPHSGVLTLYHDDYQVSTGWLTPVTTLPAALGILALGVIAMRTRHRVPLVSLGILWFLGGHLLTSTVIPLELVHEHRNYLPSAGIFLALFSLVLRRGLPLSVPRVAFSVGLVVLYGFVTLLRAATWGDPLLLVSTEAARHPASPRAGYDQGLILTFLSPDPRSRSFRLGMTAFERAAKLPKAGLLPDQALIMLSSKHGLPIDPHWWERMYRRAERGPLSTQDISALYSLIACRIAGACPFQPKPLGEILDAAVQRHPTRHELVTLYANYAANVRHDLGLALILMQRAVALRPKNVRYWANLVQLQIFLRQEWETRYGIERIWEATRYRPFDRQLDPLLRAYRDAFGHPWRRPSA